MKNRYDRTHNFIYICYDSNYIFMEVDEGAHRTFQLEYRLLSDISNFHIFLIAKLLTYVPARQTG
jgi:hypothetical protein